MIESCLICLEETDLENKDPENKVICLNLSKEKNDPCNCKIYCHVKCWMDYYIRKGYFECPICHSKFKTNVRQEQTITINNANSIYTVSIPINIEDQVQITLPSSIRSNQVRTIELNKNTLMFCFMIVLVLLLISFPFIMVYKR
jgi:hypothetical protein